MCHVARLHLRQDVADNAPSTHRKCRPLPCRARAIPAGLACDADGQKCAWSRSLTRQRCRGARTADPVESAVEAGAGDRKSVVSGKSVPVRVDLGGGRIVKKTSTMTHTMKRAYITRN